jgi:hypothetical protein
MLRNAKSVNPVPQHYIVPYTSITLKCEKPTATFHLRVDMRLEMLVPEKMNFIIQLYYA